MRLVLDTSVVVAALRSSSGASAELLRQAFSGAFEWLISNTSLLELEDVLGRAEHQAVTHVQKDDLEVFLASILRVAEPVLVTSSAHALMKDVDDAFVVALAVDGRADAIVTHNVRDFRAVVASLEIALYTPAEALTALEANHG